MERREIVRTEAAPLEQRNRQGITNGHRHGCAGGRCQVLASSFFAHAHIERHIARLGECRMHFSGQRDERRFQTL